MGGWGGRSNGPRLQKKKKKISEEEMRCVTKTDLSHVEERTRTPVKAPLCAQVPPLPRPSEDGGRGLGLRQVALTPVCADRCARGARPSSSGFPRFLGARASAPGMMQRASASLPQTVVLDLLDYKRLTDRFGEGDDADKHTLSIKNATIRQPLWGLFPLFWKMEEN